ncbi:6156_t:CDS:2 [Gigaspora margarita]|uniref:6156_t:CDS:1 n=1 Tax=Gigaspora margarita TaxID=4874 RepID=A0ABN7VUW8_GIGMA|nr:6156_t:CDS:2 [Gigaspora margarita]
MTSKYQKKLLKTVQIQPKNNSKPNKENNQKTASNLRKKLPNSNLAKKLSENSAKNSPKFIKENYQIAPNSAKKLQKNSNPVKKITKKQLQAWQRKLPQNNFKPGEKITRKQL